MNFVHDSLKSLSLTEQAVILCITALLGSLKSLIGARASQK